MVESNLHSVDRVLSNQNGDGSLAMLLVDFSNAFNMVYWSSLLHVMWVKFSFISLWVEFLYGQTTRLYLGDGHIMSAIRVQQGDLLEPLIFLLCYTHIFIILETIVSFLFMHNILMKDHHREFIQCGQSLRHYSWDASKTDIIWPSYDGNKVHGDLFPSDIRRLILGTKLLVGVVSRDYGFIEFFSSWRELPWILS